MSRPGLLKRRLVIQRPTTTIDELGGQRVVLTNVGEIWAQVTRLGGSRGLEYEQTASSRPFRVTTRSNVSILEDDQIQFEGMVLIVSTVDRDWDLYKYQTLICTAKYSG
jgi:head-tail adaptor